MRRPAAAFSALILLLLAAAAQAASTSYVDVGSAWVDLGAGPIQFQASGSGLGAAYSIGDSAPAAASPGFSLLPQQPASVYQGTSHVYVRAPYGTTATARVVYGPAASASIGSVSTAVPAATGTGGTTALSLGTTATSNAIPAPASGSTRRSLFIYNQSATATATFCTAASGLTPSPNLAGCFTLSPNGGFLAYPANGYVPQDAYSASASAPNTPVTYEAH